MKLKQLSEKDRELEGRGTIGEEKGRGQLVMKERQEKEGGRGGGGASVFQCPFPYMAVGDFASFYRYKCGY